MPTVAQSLTRGMDPSVRGLVERRATFMIRQLNYLKTKNNRHLLNANRAGWTTPRLEIVCWLNSFFQVVITPLAASAKPSSQIGLGSTVPILYVDQLKFDLERGQGMQLMTYAFYALCSNAGILNFMLTAHRADDLVYLISRRISENE